MTVALSALTGVLLWTLLEYVIHRWLGHDRRLVKKTPFGHEHTAHHSRGDYFAPWWKKAAAAALVTGLLAPPAVLLAGPTHGWAFVAGFVGFYLAYELIHRLEHVWGGVGPYARWARRHHFYHHFHDPRMNHGVTSPIWDLVFGTYVRPERIRVPEKLALRWLRDPETGAVKARYADVYELRPAKRQAAAA